MAKFSEVQHYLLEAYMSQLAQKNSELAESQKKSYLKTINMNIVTTGSFWTDLYISDEDGYNFEKIYAQIRKINRDQFTFLLKEES